MAPLVQGVDDRKWIQNVAAGCYATASSAGSLYFALNFGDQGGAPVRSWVFRASIIQGTQQVYIAFLWCWGAAVALKSQSGQNTSFVVTDPATTTSIGVIVAVFLWGVGSLLFFGLPDYYRQTPGTVPSFLSGILRRKIVLWFFIMVVRIENIGQLLLQQLISLLSDSPKLLPLRPLRQELALPLVLPTPPNLGRRRPCHHLLHHNLGCYALRGRPP